MTKEKNNSPRSQYNATSFPGSEQIRKQAEKKAKDITFPDLGTMTQEEIQQRFHELQVRQIEMELQVEHLQRRPKEYNVKAELLMTVTENMLDMIGLTDIEGNFIYACKVHEVLGYEWGFLIGKNVMDFVHPEDLSHLHQDFRQLLASGVSNPVEHRYRKMDGSYLWFETVGRVNCDENGTPHQIVFNARDITERKHAEDNLKKLEWMLSDKALSTDDGQTKDYDQGYGDLTELNRDGIILKSIGRERLESLASDYLDLLGTSSAIYEVNGDYAFGIFSSGWCQMMDRASRELCNTSDNVEALNCGRWLCHESCWMDCSQKIIAECTPMDIECNGGIRLYGVPIIVSGKVVGVINFGYGDPPKDPEKLRKIADTYHIEYDDLVRKAYAYDSRPPFIIELAKKRLHASARIIGSMIETKQAEDALEHSYGLMRYIIEHTNSAVAVHDRDLKYVYVSQQYLEMYGVKETDVIGRHHYDIFPDLPDKWRDVHQEALAGKVSRSERDSYPREDGTLDWTRWECRPCYEADGSIGGIVVYTEIITDRVAAEEALRQSENYYRTIFETSGSAMLIIEEDTTISRVNSNFVELSGYLPREIEGKKSWTEFVHPDDVVWMKENHYLRRQDPDAVPRRYEFRFISRHKEMRYILLSVGMIPGTDQRVASCTDITERKQAETYREIGREILQVLNEPGDLQESIQRVLATLKTRTGFDAVGLRLQEGEDFPYFVQDGFSKDFLLTENTLIERGKDGGVCRDKDGNVRLECTCGLVISGKTDPSDPLFTRGGSCWTNDSFPLLDLPSDQDLRIHPRNNCIHQGYASVALIPVRTIDRIVGLIQLNDKRKGRFTLETIEILEGIAAHIGSALMRKQAEQALAESETRFKALHNASFGGIAIHDQGIILECNQGLSDMTGYQYSELIGMDGLLLIAERSREAVMNNIRTGYEKPYEAFGLRKNGEEFPLQIEARNVPYKGKQVRTVEFRDITERKQAEEALRQINETLEQQVAERTELAETRARQLQALAVELIEAEERERQRIAELLHNDLQQMLASARFQLQAANVNLQNEPILTSVNEILKESIAKSRKLSHELSFPGLHHGNLYSALEWLGSQMNEQFGLTIELKDEKSPNLENTTLKVFLFRAVQELLFNIVKHAGVKSARVTLSGSNDTIAVFVADQGKGFSKDSIDSSPERPGFGLISIRERADRIGGHLKIESEPGQGSSFLLVLPVQTAPAEEPVKVGELTDGAVPKSISVLKLLRILFVDDHKVMRQGLITLISGQTDIEVAGEAANGREAVELARHLRPDVIVMDISMPVMDGIEATRLIKSEFPEVRIVGLSMFEDEQSVKSIIHAGADAFVPKTTSSNELLKAVYGNRE